MDYLMMKRKKLLYRSCHRGCKEMDIILGRFALHYIDKLTPDEVDLYEAIVEAEDYDLYLYITKSFPVPLSLDRDLMNRIIEFNRLSVYKD